jgi:hypothetical protein
MQRTPNGPSRPQNNTANSEITTHKSTVAARAQQHDQVGTFWDMLAIRVVFVAICVARDFIFGRSACRGRLARRRDFCSRWR